MHQCYHTACNYSSLASFAVYLRSIDCITLAFVSFSFRWMLASLYLCCKWHDIVTQHVLVSVCINSVRALQMLAVCLISVC